MDGAYEFGIRTRNRTPAIEPFPLPPPLQRMLGNGKANLAAPFKGLTSDRHGRAGPLPAREDRATRWRPVVDAARAYISRRSPRPSAPAPASRSTARRGRPGATSIPS